MLYKSVRKITVSAFVNSAFVPEYCCRVHPMKNDRKTRAAMVDTKEREKQKQNMENGVKIYCRKKSTYMSNK